jgi:hypothetical protein
VQLGLENKKKTIWAAALGVIAVLVFAYEIVPLFMGAPETSSNAQAAAPAPPRVTTAHAGARGKKQQKLENLDPTLHLDLLASSEQTQYSGTGRNIFVSQAEDPVIPIAVKNGTTDHANDPPPWVLPAPPAPPPIPLKFFGFASKPGESKRIFLQQNDDVWVVGEGEIVNRRYKIVHISNSSVDIQDMVSSGPAQTIPLTQG